MFPIDVLRFSEFMTMKNHLSETLMLNDIQITSDYMDVIESNQEQKGSVCHACCKCIAHDFEFLHFCDFDIKKK